jgi:hypothetical protein
MAFKLKNPSLMTNAGQQFHALHKRDPKRNDVDTVARLWVNLIAAEGARQGIFCICHPE